MSGQSWKNKDIFEHEGGRVVRQVRSGRKPRLRIDLDGMEHLYVPEDRIVDLADMLDDLCDSKEDGEF